MRVPELSILDDPSMSRLSCQCPESEFPHFQRCDIDASPCLRWDYWQKVVCGLPLSCIGRNWWFSSLVRMYIDFLRNFDDFNPYFRFFWDHWWLILQQLPSAWIRYISRPIGIVPSQDLGLSCDCFEIVLFCKLDRSFIDWNDCATMFCKSFLLWIFWLILEITILISIHILIRWNIQASVALAAMEANDIASVYFTEISMCRQTSATKSPTCKTEHQEMEMHQ
jgi:hypothetical protein